MSDNPDWLDQLCEQDRTIEDLRARIAELERDAARWREFERLRERLSFYVLNPSENTSFLYPEHFEKHGSNKTAVAEDIIDACHIRGVPVPPHLKPYEERT